MFSKRQTASPALVYSPQEEEKDVSILPKHIKTVSQPNRYKSKTKSRSKKSAASTSRTSEGKGYTFSLPACFYKDKSETKKRFYTKNIQRRGTAATEQPPTLGCSRVTKVCMGNHGTWIHALNRGCGAVPSIVTVVLWRNLAWLLVQPEWMTAQTVVSHIQHPAANHNRRLKTQTQVFFFLKNVSTA